MSREADRALIRPRRVNWTPCIQLWVRTPLAVLAAATVLNAGCTESTKPADRLIEVLSDRQSYRAQPPELVVITTRAAIADTIFDDHCGGELQGFEYLGRWNGSYGGGRVCLRGQPIAGRDRIPIPPGTVHMDTFHVNDRAYTGTWRVELNLRDRDGVLFPLEQRISNTFRIEGTWTP